MNAQIDDASSKPASSFFTKAAWYSLVVPVVTGLISWGILAFTDCDLVYVSGAAFWVLLTSFIVGSASLFGIEKNCRRGILWKAVPGIIASSVLIYIALTVWDFARNFHFNLNIMQF